jgi:hypothetical protein
VLEGLAHFPGALQLLGFRLQIAPRHIDAYGVAEHVLHRVGGLDVGAAGL